jgi:hypothetical protein
VGAGRARPRGYEFQGRWPGSELAGGDLGVGGAHVEEGQADRGAPFPIQRLNEENVSGSQTDEKRMKINR